MIVVGGDGLVRVLRFDDDRRRRPLDSLFERADVDAESCSGLLGRLLLAGPLLLVRRNDRASLDCSLAIFLGLSLGGSLDPHGLPDLDLEGFAGPGDLLPQIHLDDLALGSHQKPLGLRCLDRLCLFSPQSRSSVLSRGRRSIEVEVGRGSRRERLEEVS